ncbi:hypothetical protein D3C74_343040 [compost metagenome]
MLLKNSSGPGQHNAVHANQDNHGEQADASPGTFTEKMAVEILIRLCLNAPGDDHHFGAEPDKQDGGKQDGQHRPVSITCEETEDFLAGSETGAYDSTNIGKGDLQCADMGFHGSLLKSAAKIKIAIPRIALCSPYSTGYDDEQKDMTSA